MPLSSLDPRTGEINYLQIARILRELNYEGVIGLEAFPKTMMRRL